MLQIYKVDHAEKTFGMWIAMDGNQEKQFEILKGNAVMFGDQIRVSNATPAQIGYMFKSSFLKTVENLCWQFC